MRILFITPFPPEQPGPDGMTLIAYYLVRSLAKQHQVTVWSSSTHPRSAILWKHYLRSHQLPWYASKRLSDNISKSLQAGTEHYDLIYLHSPFSLGYIRSIHGTPVVAGVIDTMSDWFHQAAQFEASWLKRLHYRRESKLSRKLEEELLANDLVKKIVVVSQTDQTKLGVSPKIVVIPNGVDTATFKPSHQQPKQAAIIFTGIMNYAPNADAVEYFYQSIWPQVRTPQLKWLVVGKHPTAAMQNIAKRDPNIVVTGTVPSIVPYLQKAQVYVAPVRFGTGIKNKLLEAMACGLPVVALPGSTGGLESAPIQLADGNQFATTLNRLLHSESERASLGQAGRNYIETHHTWEAVCSSYAQVFTAALEESNL
jgi:glycosyltransferase involved in cell wall biosynthesis